MSPEFIVQFTVGELPAAAGYQTLWSDILLLCGEIVLHLHQIGILVSHDAAK